MMTGSGLLKIWVGWRAWVVVVAVVAVCAGELEEDGDVKSFEERLAVFQNTPIDAGINFKALKGPKAHQNNGKEPTGRREDLEAAVPPLHVTGQDWEASNPIFTDARVTRGPSWKWGDVDGGAGALGRVVGPSAASNWWRVRWDNGHENAYRYGGGTHDLIVVKDSNMDGITIFGTPARVTWTPDPTRPFAEQVALNDEPLVLLNTSAVLWPAMQKWSPQALAETHGDLMLSRVKLTRRRPKGNTPFFYYHNAPMNSTQPDVAAYKTKAYSVTNMTVAELVRNITAPPAPGERTAVYAGKLDDWGVDVLTQVLPLDPFMVIQPGFEPEKEHLFRQTHVWIGGRDTSTPAHFDLFHNFYVVIHGRKRVLLFPPSQWQQLYLFPLLHPAGRSVQVDLDAPLFEQKHAFPHYTKNHTLALEVILHPGQVLYIPPLWFHHVTSLEPSVALSVWTPHPAIEIAAKAAEDVPLPIRLRWSEKEKHMALRIFFESLFESLHMDMNIASFLHWTLLDNRYKYIGALKAEEGSTDGPYCDDPLTTARLIEEAGESVFRPPLKRVVGIFKDVHRIGGEDRLVIELANYYELAAAAVLPVTEVKQFFHDMVYC